MTYRFSQTVYPGENISISLERIYHVRADREYDIFYQDREEGFAVFRTTSGLGRIILNDGQREDLPADSLIIVRWNEVKRYFCQGESWEFLWFRFQTENSLPLPVKRVISLPLGGEDKILINQCLELTEVPYKEAGALASSLMAMLIHRWAFEWIRSVSPRTLHETSIDRIKSLIKQDLSRKISSSILASETGLSERRFRALFKEISGESPRDYYNRIRMEAGADMLSFSPCSLSEIASQLGYCDPFHFSKVFKKYYGKPPRHYREVIKNPLPGDDPDKGGVSF